MDGLGRSEESVLQPEIIVPFRVEQHSGGAPPETIWTMVVWWLEELLVKITVICKLRSAFVSFLLLSNAKSCCDADAVG